MAKPSDFFLSSADGYFADLSGKWFMHAGYNQREIETIAFEPGDPNRRRHYSTEDQPSDSLRVQGCDMVSGGKHTGMAWQYRHLFTQSHQGL
jgi:hypothetical protein